MRVDAELLVGNDNLVSVQLVLAPDNDPLDDASVSVDLLDEAGEEVTSTQQLQEKGLVPLLLDDGTTVQAREYATVLDASVPIVKNRAYLLVVTANHPDGHDAEVRVRRIAKERTG